MPTRPKEATETMPWHGEDGIASPALWAPFILQGPQYPTWNPAVSSATMTQGYRKTRSWPQDPRGVYFFSTSPVIGTKATGRSVVRS